MLARMQLDPIAEAARERWNALARSGNTWTRPKLEFSAEDARAELEEFGLHFDPAGKHVLCLAAGGGQQSVVYSLLGAQVTVLELSDEQLAADAAAARQHGYELRLEQGDMRELGRFEDESFDHVAHGWSIAFVPDAERALAEAMRVLRPGGSYTLEFANPISVGLNDDGWNGAAYPLRFPFVDGALMDFGDDPWSWEQDGRKVEMQGPSEWRHSLAKVIGTLAGAGLVIERLAEHPPGDATAQPGSWEHFCAHTPPWLRLVGHKR